MPCGIGCSFDSFSVFLLSLKQQQNLMKIMFSCIHFPEWPYPPQNNEKAVFYTGELYGLTGREIRKNGLTVRASVMWQNDGPGMVSEKVVLREGWSCLFTKWCEGRVSKKLVLKRWLVLFVYIVIWREGFWKGGLKRWVVLFIYLAMWRECFWKSGLKRCGLVELHGDVRGRFWKKWSCEKVW